MKLLKSSLLLFAILCTVVSTQSCKEECEDIVCQNDGICVDGTCECPDGYTGDDCGTLNVNLGLQALLDAGISPSELLNSFEVAELYGKTYKDGIIFYLNPGDGSGMVAAMEDLVQGNGAIWGCVGTDIMGLNNVPFNGSVLEGSGAEIGDGATNTTAILMGCTADGIAAKLCRGLGEEWFLPSIKELELMFTNLKNNGDLGGFAAVFYWSSTEGNENFAWGQFFNGAILGVQGSAGKEDPNPRVRAARAFTQ